MGSIFIASPSAIGAVFRWGRRPCLPWLAGTEARPTYRLVDFL